MSCCSRCLQPFQFFPASLQFMHFWCLLLYGNDLKFLNKPIPEIFSFKNLSSLYHTKGKSVWSCAQWNKTQTKISHLNSEKLFIYPSLVIYLSFHLNHLSTHCIQITMILNRLRTCKGKAITLKMIFTPWHLLFLESGVPSTQLPAFGFLHPCWYHAQFLHINTCTHYN